MTADAQSFVDRFTTMWRDPQPDTFSDLFHEDGTLFHPMEAPIGRDAVPEYVNRLKALAPDIRLEVRNWAASGDVVLIEWTISATYGGEQMEVEGADRFTLRGDRAVEGVAYFDTLELWAKIDPSMERGHLLDAATTEAQ